VPCVTGLWWRAVHPKLLSSSVRVQTGVGGGYGRSEPDVRFEDLGSGTKQCDQLGAERQWIVRNESAGRTLPALRRRGCGEHVAAATARSAATVDYDTISDVIFPRSLYRRGRRR